MKLIQRIFGHLVVLALCSAIGYWVFHSSNVTFVAFTAFILSNRILPSESDPRYPFAFRVEPRNYITKSSDGAANAVTKLGHKMKQLGQKLKRKKD